MLPWGGAPRGEATYVPSIVTIEKGDPSRQIRMLLGFNLGLSTEVWDLRGIGEWADGPPTPYCAMARAQFALDPVTYLP